MLLDMSTDLLFSSRRSPVVCLHGCVASNQPLASNIGLDILKKGGNAADAAVAMAAALAVTEPSSTGIGGDSFCLFYEASTGKVRGLNGSGRAPRAQSIDFLERRGYNVSNPPPPFHALNVTVPGAAACWCDTVSLFGSQQLSLQEVLHPATELARVGFPVAKVTAYHWAKWVDTMRDAGREVGSDFLINGQAPNHGQVFRNPALSRTFQGHLTSWEEHAEEDIRALCMFVLGVSGSIPDSDSGFMRKLTVASTVDSYRPKGSTELLLGQQGKAGFYSGRVAEAIVDVIRENEGVMCLDDLGSHNSQEITPIYTDYKGVRLWEPPPNGQGMAALIALNILENFPVKEFGHNSASYLHVVAEALKLSLADTMRYCGDPDHVTTPLEGLLAKDYGHQRSRLIDMERARSEVECGVPTGSDTVYFCVVDGQGNACSLVNSNYMGFGTGLVPEGCGFSLQNRGANFSLDRNHGNCIGGGKRPYHTIMAAMLTDPASGHLLCSLGVMGGFMQPQGHVQVLLNMCEFGMDPQQALDAPRVFVQHDPTGRLWNINLEEGVDQRVAEDLQRRGHVVNWPVSGHERSKFGRGQVISVGDWWNKAVHHEGPDVRVLWAGSDARGDGCAQGF